MTVYINGVDQVSHVIWKDVSERVVDDNDRSADLDWTELDLTTYTSSRAKFAILRLRIAPGTVGTGLTCSLHVRKNDQSLYYFADVVARKSASGAGESQGQHVIAGLRSGQKIDYRILVGTGWTIDSDIYVLGYIE